MPLLYFSGIVSLALLCLLAPLKKQNNTLQLVRPLLILISILFFSIFYSSRSINSGNDTINYFNAFSYYKNLALSDLSFSGLSYGYISQEKGYSLISFMLSAFTSFNEFLAIIAFTALLTSFLFYRKILRKDSSLAFFAFLCGVSPMFMYGAAVRQGLALPIAFIGLAFLLDKKTLIGLAFLLGASLIHSSVYLFAIIITAGTILANTKIIINSNRVFVSFFIAFVVFYLASKYSVYLYSINGVFFQKVAYYLQYKGEDVGVVALTYPLVFFAIFYLIYDNAPDAIKALIVIYGSIFAIQILFKDAAEPFYRIGMYRFFLEPILLVFTFRHLSRVSSISYLAICYPFIFIGLAYSYFYTFTREEVRYTLGL